MPYVHTQVAGNPALYSQAQIQNFLKSSALNQKVMSLKDVVGAEGSARATGERIASDGSRKFIILKDKPLDDKKKDEKGASTADEDAEDESITGSSKKGKRRIVQEEEEDDHDFGGDLSDKKASENGAQAEGKLSRFRHISSCTGDN